jgi:GTP-binding protein
LTECPKIEPPKVTPIVLLDLYFKRWQICFDYSPKIGDYPYTTLVPNLGVVSYRDDKSFVMADIPGIIEGAAEGKGLGIRFLRHIERNSILLFLIPADAKDIKEQYQILLGELRKYNPELLDKKRLLAVSKVDMLDEELMQQMERDIPNDLPYVFISSVSQYNLEKLKDLIWQAIQS